MLRGPIQLHPQALCALALLSKATPLSNTFEHAVKSGAHIAGIAFRCAKVLQEGPENTEARGKARVACEVRDGHRGDRARNSLGNNLANVVPNDCVMFKKHAERWHVCDGESQGQRP